MKFFTFFVLTIFAFYCCEFVDKYDSEITFFETDIGNNTFALSKYNAIQIALPNFTESFNITYQLNGLVWNEDIYYITSLIGCRFNNVINHYNNMNHINIFVNNNDLNVDDIVINVDAVSHEYNTVKFEIYYCEIGTDNGVRCIYADLDLFNETLLIEFDIKEPIDKIEFDIINIANINGTLLPNFRYQDINIRTKSEDYPFDEKYHNFTKYNGHYSEYIAEYIIEKPDVGKRYVQFKYDGEPIIIHIAIILGNVVPVFKLDGVGQTEITLLPNVQQTLYLPNEMDKKVLALYSDHHETYQISVAFGSPFTSKCQYNLIENMSVYKLGPFLNTEYGIFIRIHHIGAYADIVFIRLEEYCFPECQYGECLDNICICNTGWYGDQCQYHDNDENDDNDDNDANDSDGDNGDEDNSYIIWITILFWIMFTAITTVCLYSLLVEAILWKSHRLRDVENETELIPINQLKNKQNVTINRPKNFKQKLVLNLTTFILAVFAFIFHIIMMVNSYGYEYIVLIIITMLIIVYAIIKFKLS